MRGSKDLRLYTPSFVLTAKLEPKGNRNIAICLDVNTGLEMSLVVLISTHVARSCDRPDSAAPLQDPPQIDHDSIDACLELKQRVSGI
jgi:hypothetical protein